MTVETQASPLARIVQATGIELAKANLILDTLGPLASQAAKLIEKSREITVTDATQVSEMKAARKARLELRDIRVAADKARKGIKADALILTRLIDDCGNLIKGQCEAEEARLQEAEDFAARKEAERKAATKRAREGILAPFGIDLSFYDLANMPEATFTELHESTRLAAEARKAAAEKAEADRIAAAKARAEEDARIRAENAKLMAEKLAAEGRERAAQEAARKERDAAEVKARIEREAVEARARKEREAIEAKARQDREVAENKARAERMELERNAKAEREAAEAKAKKEREAAAAKLKKEQDARKRLEAAADELLNELGAIADALKAGETVTIEPGSVKAAGILAVVAAAEGGAA